MRGTVVDQNGAPVANASVTIIHVPTSTVSVATTSANGNFAASGLRVGGPYRIFVDAAGYEGDIVDNLNLAPGVNPPVRASLRVVEDVETIVVTGIAGQSINLNNGAGSTFTARDILNQPSFNRDLVSTLLRDPLANSSGATGNLSVAGSNPRFNVFVIDGVRQSDDFGLSQSTYATSRSPISLDAVEAVSVSASDYSVFQSGFTGGLVNVVTRGGTNDFSGTLSYYRSGDDYQSNTAFGRYIDSPAFTEEEYGFTFGGPILRDRLFFFVGYEKFETARPVGFANSDAQNGIQPGFHEALRQLIQTSLGYDVGARPTVASIPEASERYFARIDWNINDDHRLQLSYQRTEEAGTSNVAAGNFESAWYDTPVELDAYNIQLSSQWTPNFSTLLRVGYKEFSRGQDCRAGTDVGQIFVTVNENSVAGTPLDGLITSGTANRSFIGGCDRSRHANEFSDERLVLFGQGDYIWGDHVVSFGGERNTYSLYNLFVQDASGNFQFTGPNAVTNLINGTAFVDFRAPQSLVRSEGATNLEYTVWSAFIQDQWQITPDISITYGLRYERYTDVTSLIPRADFDALYGANGRRSLDGLDLIQPRFGFRWDVLDRTTLSGGFGLFAGGDPNVWFSNTFLPQNFVASGTFNNVDPRVVPQALRDAVAASNPNTLAPIDTIAPDFKIPSTWRSSLTLQHEFDLSLGGFNLGRDYMFEAQILHSRVNQGYSWRNLPQIALGLPVGTAPDGRPVYSDLQALNQQVGVNFQNAVELYNVSDGESWVYTVSLANEFENGFGFYLAYAYQDVEDIVSGASSVAVSNYNNQLSVDRNNQVAGRSVYETAHKFTVGLSFERDIFTDLTSRLDVFGVITSGRAGTPTFTTIANNPLFGRSAIQSTSSTDLLYVPLENDPLVSYGPGFNQAAFNAFIDNHGLTRGQIVERGALSSPWGQEWSLRFQQQLPFASFGIDRFQNNRATFVVDVQNFPNLLNNKWGRNYSSAAGNFGSLAVVTADMVRTGDPTFRPLNSRDSASSNPANSAGYDPNFDPAIVCASAGACQYRFNTFTNRTTGNEDLGASLYRIRLGLRYEF
ncbi:MAG: carboxypeptidase regulatory-like domain-containing protein [Glycocaulis sp.]